MLLSKILKTNAHQSYDGHFMTILDLCQVQLMSITHKIQNVLLNVNLNYHP